MTKEELREDQAAYRIKYADKIRAYRESHRAEQKEYREQQKAKQDIGVYEIINIKTHERYIGSTAVGFKQRWAAHKCNLESGDHKCKALQDSYNTYGADSFVYQVLDRCDSAKCRVAEKLYIASTEKCYLFNTKLRSAT